MMHTNKPSPGLLAQRRQTLERLSDEPLDVLVIGGGIVGAGIARDAALRGLRTGLVEQYDFAYGTSSRSSRLLHGGLRYLAQGRLGLVREASVEKSIVHKIAPHISEPLRFVFPTYQGMPWDQWAKWRLQVGVRIYDMLCGGRNLGKSGSLSAHQLTELLPGINSKNTNGGVYYFDGFTNDARLVIDTLRSAENAGAIVLNYCRVADTEHSQPLWRCTATDSLTNDTAVITSKCVVNATGPWSEQFKQSSIPLRLTKGVHLVVSRDRLPVPDAVVMIEGTRILFAIPWGERVILGTTDTDYDGKPEDVAVDTEDIGYILGVVNGAFPEAGLTVDDVIGSWAGLRPLIANASGKPSDISRSHLIRMPQDGWFDVAGGKLTTYRLMAQQAVDRIERCLGRGVSRCVTADQPLLSEAEISNVSGILPPEPSRELVEHYCKREWAVHLEDIMVRRTSWAHYRTDADELAARVAGWMGDGAW